MNNTSANIIKRQLMIIKFLLESNYVSTEDVQNHLKKVGIDVQIRSIQRDLAVLEEIIPLECKKEDKPYSWRWQRMANTTIHGLSMSQALALRIVETELKGVLPDDLYQRLTPLFVKAQFIRGISDINSSKQKSVEEFIDSNPTNIHKPNGIISISPSQQILLKLRMALTRFQSTSKQHNQNDKINTEYQKELKNLSKVLKDKELDFLADMLDNQKGFDKQ
jgi:hypothetical protein